jgi:hypothetical protein
VLGENNSSENNSSNDSTHDLSSRDVSSREVNSRQATDRQVSGQQTNRQKTSGRRANGQQETEEDRPDFSGFSERKQALGQKLLNVGIWPDRARECLRRHTARRIEANFSPYRKRAPNIENDGAWLCAAITDGYADLKETHTSKTRSSRTDNSRTSAPPAHKQKVSPEEKKRLTRRHDGVEAGHFHRFRHGERPTEKQFLYLDPEEGGPTWKRRTV